MEKCIVFEFCILLTSLGVPGVCGEVTLNTPLNIGDVRHGDRLVFTCTTRGSNLLSWTSDDYIGHNGGTLTLATVNSVRSPNSYTNATLFENRFDNGVQVLISQLQIIVQPNFFSSSVTCRNAITGEEQTANFTPIAYPSVATDRHKVCPEDNRTFTCETRGSNTIQWMSIPYTGLSGLMLSGGDAKSMGQTTARIVANYSVNGVRVIRSELNITVTPDIKTDVRQYITCVNYDLQNERVVSIQLNDHCENTNVTNSTTVEEQDLVEPTTDPLTCVYTTIGDSDIKGADVSISTAVLIVIALLLAVSVVINVVQCYQYKKLAKGKKVGGTS